MLTWLRTAQPDDPFVVITSWNAQRLPQLGTSEQAVVQLLIGNGAGAAACASCFFFTSTPAMLQCRIALGRQAPQLLGFSDAVEACRPWRKPPA